MTLVLPPIDPAALLAALPPIIAADIRDLHDQGLDDDAIGAIRAAQGVVGVKTTPLSFSARPLFMCGALRAHVQHDP